MATVGDRIATRVDRNAAVPLYFQLREILLKEVGSAFREGDMLPAEGVLCARYGVSRTVVRQALEELRREGALYTVRGKGTFVTRPKLETTHVQQVAGFFAAMREDGHLVESDVIRQVIVGAPARVAQLLAIPVGGKVIAIDRVRKVDGLPWSVVRAMLPQALCPGLEEVDLRTASLYGVLGERFGLRPHHGDRTIEAVAIGSRDAALLGVRAASPALRIESVVRAEDDTPLEYFLAVYRGDRSKLDIKLIER